MSHLLRPSIPLAVKLAVLLRALGYAFSEDLVQIAKERRCLGAIVKEKQEELAALLGCASNEIDYDHEPSLGARRKVFKNGIHVEYAPAANDPDHIFARTRTHHRHKTNVAGEHGQHPDRVLIKKNRRLEKARAERPRARSAMLLPKPTFKKATKIRGRKSAPLHSANRWPPAGSRKIQNRGFQSR